MGTMIRRTVFVMDKSNRSLQRKSRRAFTLIEVLVASTLLGFALIVMFGMHAQALRSNMHAKKMTDCAYLAQTQMEHLIQLGWTRTTMPTVLSDAGGADPTTTANMWGNMEHTGAVNGYTPALSGNTIYGPRSYSLTWDVHPMDSANTWQRLRVRCSYTDRAFSSTHGTTISTYRFRDN